MMYDVHWKQKLMNEIESWQTLDRYAELYGPVCKSNH